MVEEYWVRRIDIISRVLLFAYLLLVVFLFYAQNMCFLRARTADSPDINFYLVAFGVLLQVFHAGVIVYFVLRAVPARLFTRGTQGGLLILLLVFGFSGYGAVRHGLLQGDKGRAFFQPGDPCDSWTYTIRHAIKSFGQ